MGEMRDYTNELFEDFCYNILKKNKGDLITQEDYKKFKIWFNNKFKELQDDAP